jgi:hypothetical protein
MRFHGSLEAIMFSHARARLSNLTSRQLSEAWTGAETVLPSRRKGVFMKGTGSERPAPPSWARKPREDPTD